MHKNIIQDCYINYIKRKVFSCLRGSHTYSLTCQQSFFLYRAYCSPKKKINPFFPQFLAHLLTSLACPQCIGSPWVTVKKRSYTFLYQKQKPAIWWNICSPSLSWIPTNRLIPKRLQQFLINFKPPNHWDTYEEENFHSFWRFPSPDPGRGMGEVKKPPWKYYSSTLESLSARSTWPTPAQGLATRTANKKIK